MGRQKNKRTLKRINTLVKRQYNRDCYTGIGKPESLKGELSGWWSRRIDEVNRIVYRGRERWNDRNRFLQRAL